MKSTPSPKSTLKSLGAVKRRQSVSLSQETLIQVEQLQPENPLPLVMKPIIEGLNLVEWTRNNRQFVETKLLAHGGLLFRNFKVNGAEDIEAFVQALSGELMEYAYRSTPRQQVRGNIYTSTEYPAAQIIPLHNEMSYSRNWPLKIAFHCVIKAQTGGETPIADSRRVFQRIDPKIRDRFQEKQILYVRNYGKGLDLPWETVFQTTEQSEVETYCQNNGIELEWLENNRLKTRQVCQAIATHPKTNDSVWFNQAHLFHISSLEPALREQMLSRFPESELPRNTYYGDGTAIEASILDEIREIYQQESVIFPWEEGDVLLLDNMLAAHGRRPFTGARQVVVGMAEPFAK